MPLYFDRSSLTSGKQAQQQHRFILRVAGIDAALIKDVAVPKYKIDTTTYDLLDYKFNYPGKVTWTSPVDFTIIQLIDQGIFYSTIGFFMSKLYNYGYNATPTGIGSAERDITIPSSLFNTRQGINALFGGGIGGDLGGYVRSASEGTVLDLSKGKLTAAIGNVIISSLDEEGRVFDSWRLNNAFISSITPTDYTYDSEKISTVKVSLAYDWAEYGFRGVFAEENAVKSIVGL